MTDSPRTQLVAAVADTARQIAAVLDQNPIRGRAPYPLAEVHRQLAEQHAALQRAVQAHPLALAVDTNGRPDKLGSELAGLMAMCNTCWCSTTTSPTSPTTCAPKPTGISRRSTSRPVAFAIEDTAGNTWKAGAWVGSPQHTQLRWGCCAQIRGCPSMRS
jgi:hypothetical protein